MPGRSSTSPGQAGCGSSRPPPARPGRPGRPRRPLPPTPSRRRAAPPPPRSRPRPRFPPGPCPASAPGARKAVPKLGVAGGSGGAQNRSTSAPLSAALVAIVVLGVAAATPLVVRSFTRRRRWFRAADDAGRAHAAWLEFRDDLTDHRIASRASESPRALAGRVGASLGFTATEREALERIALAEERARYARAPVASAAAPQRRDHGQAGHGQGVPPARQVRRHCPARIRPGSGADGDDERARRLRLDGRGQQQAAPARRAGRPLRAEPGDGGLPVPLLATAPALFQPLHEPGSAGPPAPVLAGRPSPALAPRRPGRGSRSGRGSRPVAPAPRVVAVPPM